MWVRRGVHVLSALPPLARRSTRVSGPPVRRGSRLRLEEAGMKVSRIVTAGVAALGEMSTGSVTEILDGLVAMFGRHG